MDNKKKPLRFNAAMDIQLLTEVLNERPHGGGAWDNVAATLQQVGIEANARRCRERTATIVEHFRKEDRENLRKSGTEEEYTTKEALLREVSELMEAAQTMSQQEKDKKMQAREKERCQAISMRKAAMDRMSGEKVGADHPVGRPDVEEARKEHSPSTSKRRKDSEVLDFLREKYERDHSFRERNFAFEREKMQLEREKFELEKKEKLAMIALLQNKLGGSE